MHTKTITQIGGGYTAHLPNRLDLPASERRYLTIFHEGRAVARLTVAGARQLGALLEELR